MSLLLPSHRKSTPSNSDRSSALRNSTGSRSEKKRSDCNCTCTDDEENYGNINQCLPMPPSPSFPSSFLEELVAMDIKLKEVRERICFLQAAASSSYSSYENLVQIPSSSDEDQRLKVTVPHSLPLQDLQPSPFLF